MRCICTLYLLILICIMCIVVVDGIENKFLNVGEEQWDETLPLQMGSQLYQLRGLKPSTWYEVKISYPASIPASFSLQLRRGISDSGLGLNQNRRLLNTEKLIFKTDNLDSFRTQDGMYVMVNVEPEGIVAIPNIQEREHIIFNIVQKLRYTSRGKGSMGNHSISPSKSRSKRADLRAPLCFKFRGGERT